MYKKILVPVDGSATAHKGLVEAVKLARMSGAALKLVHVVNEFVDSSFGPALYYETIILRHEKLTPPSYLFRYRHWD